MKNLIYSIISVLFFLLTILTVVGMFTDGPIEVSSLSSKIFLGFVMLSVFIMFVQLTRMDLKEKKK